MYLVTGATGNVGSEVVAQLLADGKKVRVFTRDAAKVAQRGNKVEAAVGDFQRPESFARAVSGSEGVFLMNQSPDQEAFRRLIEAAKSADNPRIVFSIESRSGRRSTSNRQTAQAKGGRDSRIRP